MTLYFTTHTQRMVKRVQKFDKNCESFRNFDDGIRRNTTRRNYHYSLDELVRFGEFSDYDSLVKLDAEQIHDLLKHWIRSMKERDLSYKAAKTKLNSPELFFDMNKKSLYKKLLHKMLPDSDQLPAGDKPFTTENLWQMKQAAKKPRDIAVIDFLASTGVRPGSISDGDFSNAVGFMATGNSLFNHMNPEIITADTAFDYDSSVMEQLLSSESQEFTSKLLSRIPKNLLSSDELLFDDDQTLGMPTWFKTTAKWWIEGKISDDEFKKNVNFLRNEGLIRTR